jgi:hypothetical protein
MRRDLSKTRTAAWLRLIDRIMLCFFKGEKFDELWIGAFKDKSETLSRAREALQLIKEHDPQRYRRLTQDLKRVLICPLPASGRFNARIEACELDEKFVLAEATTPELLASVIVHEATHARLRSYGFGYKEMVRPKVEAICVRRQLAFTRKLPTGQQARQWAQETLTYCSPVNLSDASKSKRDHDWYVEEFRRLGAPNWVVRATRALGKIIEANRVRRTVRR